MTEKKSKNKRKTKPTRRANDSKITYSLHATQGFRYFMALVLWILCSNYKFSFVFNLDMTLQLLYVKAAFFF